jgi:hypothetical protein
MLFEEWIRPLGEPSMLFRDGWIPIYVIKAKESGDYYAFQHEVRIWCKKYCRNKWRDKWTYYFFFENQADATFFKLVWH